MKILITGGADQKKKGLMLKKPKDGYGYVIILDWDKKTIENQFHYFTPDDKINPNITKELTCSHIYEKELYVSSRTEVIIMDLEALKIKNKITSPSFHDLHHAMRIGQQIYVANTGLEIIQCFTLNGEELKQINLTSIPTWKRFDRSVDYRMVESTKPHKVHVNYIFERYPGELWATCMIPKEAICISGRKKFIKINEGYIHDGHVYGDNIFFTTTNGYLLGYNRKTLKKTFKYNIFTKYADEKGGNLGWCRGLGINDGRAFVGFSALRFTKNKEYLKMLLKKNNTLKTRILEVELQNGKIVGEYILPYKNSTVFSIIPYRI